MHTRRTPAFLTPLLFLALLAACLIPSAPARAADQTQGKPLVFVSILPQKDFATAIAGDLVDVEVMVMPGASPATYEPTPGQMTRLAKARAYFAIGVPFEAAWLERLASANPAMPIVHTDAGIQKAPIGAHHHDHDGDAEEHHGEEHEHHDEAGHEEHHDHDHHGILDPHIWLSPLLVKVQARNICRGLIQVDPAHAETYKANLQTLLSDINAVDADIRAALADIPENQRAFMVFHPSWGYFARQYGLRQIPIEAEGKEPGPRQLAAIVRQGQEQDIHVVFVQSQFSDKSARVIASELGARVIPLDPLAEDWADNLRSAARVFGKALR